MIRFLTVLAILLVPENGFSQSLRSRNRQETYVLTRVETKTKRKTRDKYRLDITSDSSETQLRITQASKFPTTLKRVQVRYRNKITGKTHSYSTTSHAMLSRIQTNQDLYLGTETVSPKLIRDIRNFVAGRDGGSSMKYQWHNVHAVRHPVEDEDVIHTSVCRACNRAYCQQDYPDRRRTTQVAHI